MYLLGEIHETGKMEIGGGGVLGGLSTRGLPSSMFWRKRGSSFQRVNNGLFITCPGMLEIKWIRTIFVSPSISKEYDPVPFPRSFDDFLLFKHEVEGRHVSKFEKLNFYMDFYTI